MSQLETALGPVPNRWAAAPLRHCVELRNDRTRNDSDLGPLIGLEHVESWTGRLVSRPDDDEIEGQHSLFRRGDVLFGKLRPYLAKAHRAQHDGACSAELLVLRPRAIDAGFLTYCLLCPTWVLLIASSTFGSKMPRANWEFIGHQVLPIPSMHEQRAIADFLDHETEKIDALVAKKQRLIELLQEKRTALISHAVTQGLEPDVPMEDSSAEWIGRIPSHWEAHHLFRIARMESGHTPDRQRTEFWVDCDIPWVSLNDTKYLETHDYIEVTANKINSLGLAGSSARMLPRGTVVFSRDATIGRCGIASMPLAVSQHFIAWVCGEGLLPEYLLYVLRSMTQELERHTMGSTLKTIGLPDVRRLVVPLPPIHEQRSIVERIGSEARAIDDLSGKVTDAVERLREYRSALITAAVTGQIDVGSR